MKHVIVFILVMIFSLPAYSATYYMNGDGSEDCANLHECFGIMSGGDTLIIRDGVYAGEENTIDNWHYPPSGSENGYTVVRADNAGEAIFDGEGENAVVSIGSPNSDPDTQWRYVQLQGLIFRNSFSGCINLANINHIKFIQCGFSDGVRADDPTQPEIPFDVRYFNNSLIEDCYVWGGSHYGLRILDSHDTILRRVVVRNDRTYGPYQAGIFVYSSYRMMPLLPLTIISSGIANWGFGTGQINWLISGIVFLVSKQVL